jgi:hypothetical protein
MRFLKIILTLICTSSIGNFLHSQVVGEIKMVKPTIMVIPFVTEGEDIRTILENDFDQRLALTKVKNEFDQKGYTTIDFRAKLKAAIQVNALSLDNKTSLKQQIIQFAYPDIVIEVDVNIDSTASGTSSTLNLSANDSYSGQALASSVGRSGKFYTSNHALLTEKAIEDCIADFMKILDEKFQAILKNGRTVTVNIFFNETSELTMDSEMGNDDLPLADILEMWFDENAYNNYYHVAGVTSTAMILDDVRIPLKDVRNGRNYKPTKFAIALYLYMRNVLEIPCKKSVNGSSIVLEILGIESETEVVSNKSDPDYDKIVLSVIVPKTQDSLTSTHISMVESKTHTLVNENGLSASDISSRFVIYPVIQFSNITVVEGLKNIFKVEIDFNLHIKDVQTNMVFASFSKKLLGTGLSRNDATTNAFSKIPLKTEPIQSFLQEGTSKITRFYTENCNQIIADAESLIKMDKYEEGLALLLSIPPACIDCYTIVQEKVLVFYDIYKEKYCEDLFLQAKIHFEKENFDNGLAFISRMDPSAACYQKTDELIQNYKDQVCEQYLLKANAAFSIQQFNQAAYYVQKIAAESSCHKDGLALLKEIELKTTPLERLEYERQMKLDEQNYRLKKYKVDAWKTAATAYIEAIPQTVNYTTIIK